VRLLYGIFGRMRRGRAGPRKVTVLDIRGPNLRMGTGDGATLG
jgi:hypothetical protein